MKYPTALSALVLATLIPLSKPVAAQGRCLRFDGVDDFVRIVNNGDFDFGTAGTVEAWVRRNGDGVIVNSGLNLGFSDLDGVTAEVDFGNSTPGASGGTLNSSGWTHVAATYDGSTVRLYIDGQLAQTDVVSNGLSPIQSASEAFIGVSPAMNSHWQGRIDEVRFWNVVRTDAEIGANWNTPLGGDQPGLVGYYRFDRFGGQTAVDSSPLANNGSYGASNSPESSDPNTPISDIPYCLDGAGGALLFDGVDDLATIEDSFNDFDLGSALTLECWVRIDSVGFQGVVIADGGAYGMRTGNPQSRFNGTVTTTMNDLAQSPGNYPVGTWTHRALTYDGVDMKLYRDGELERTETHSAGGATPTTLRLFLGATNAGGPLHGAMDELRIWSTVRSPEQIKHFYNLPLEGPQLDMVGLYHFDEFGGQTLRDSSGSGNHGVLGSTAAVESSDPIRVPSDGPSLCPDLSNDDCANAIDVSAGGQFLGSLSHATNDGSASCGASSTTRDIWYTYTATEIGELTATTCGTKHIPGVAAGVDTVLSFHDGCGGLELDCNDDNGDDCFDGLGSLFASTLRRSMKPGDTVLIRLSHFGNSTIRDLTVLNVSFENMFSATCSGDGGDQMGCTDCPCSNNAPQGTVGGCLNSAGTSTFLDVSGDPSVSLPSGSSADLQFSVSGSPAGATNVLLSGAALAPTGMANPCFGLDTGVLSVDRDGLRCAVQDVLRHGNRAADAMGNIGDANGPSRVWGGISNPTDGIASQGGFAAGQTRYFQITHRDDAMAGCMRGLNTSQAVGVTFTP